MTTNRWMRASDRDRESTADLLSEAYAAGRLSRDELDQRAGAAFSARTWGELRDLTSDLPAAAAGTGLPAGILASRGAPRREAWRLIGQIPWSCVLVLAAGLAGLLVIPVAVWLGAVLVPLALLLVHVVGVSSRFRGRAEYGGSGPAAEHMTFTSRYDVNVGLVRDAGTAGRPRRGQRSG